MHHTDKDMLLDIEELKSVEPTKYIEVDWFLRLLGIPSDYSYPTVPVYEYYSNPTKEDTDGDGYCDYDEVKVYNTNPKISNVEKYEISDIEFLTIDTGNSTKYDWTYYGNGSTKSYGGRQGWFRYIMTESDAYNNETYGRYLTSQTIAKSGCGLISSADSLLYISKHMGISNYIIKDWYQNDVIDINDYAEYIWYMESTQLGVDSTLGLNGYSMASGLNNYYSLHDIDLKATWGVDEYDILDKTIKMLKKDIPVTLSIGPYALGLKDGYGVNFYIEDISSSTPAYINRPWSSDKVNDHYVTVTAVIIDNITNKTYLQISSWGEKYFIDYDEYEEYLGYKLSGFSNILYIS